MFAKQTFSYHCVVCFSFWLCLCEIDEYFIYLHVSFYHQLPNERLNCVSVYNIEMNRAFDILMSRFVVSSFLVLLKVHISCKYNITVFNVLSYCKES